MSKYLDIESIVESEKYPFTKGQLRAFLLNRKKNGLNKICSKIGKRIYLREDLFDDWIDSYNEGKDEKVSHD